MQTKKMSLANIQGKLSRAEMKNIMAGSTDLGSCGNVCDSDSQCTSRCTKCKQWGTQGNKNCAS